VYGRIVELQLDTPSHARDLSERLSSDLIPELSRQPGFVAYYIVQSDDARLATLRVFDTAETLDRASQATRSIHEAIVADLGLKTEEARSFSGAVSSWFERGDAP
jgi:hypothetical protein